MAAIAVLAVVLAIARAEPGLILWAGPVAGSLLDRRAGRTGILGGVIGGMFTAWVVGVLLLVYEMYQGGYRSQMPTMRVPEFLFATLMGAFFGLLVGFIVWQCACVPGVVRYVAGIPASLRLRSARSAAANAYRGRPRPEP